MTDRERLQAMRKLGVRWLKGRAIPTYTLRMSDADKRKADTLYDAMSEEFIDAHGEKVRP